VNNHAGGILMYKCKICGDTFGCEVSLKRHVTIKYSRSKNDSHCPWLVYLSEYDNRIEYAKKSLESMYIKDKKSTPMIAEELNVNKQTLINTMKYYGIKLRNVTQASKNQYERDGIWNKGKTKHDHPSIMKYAKLREGKNNPFYTAPGVEERRQKSRDRWHQLVRAGKILDNRNPKTTELRFEYILKELKIQFLRNFCLRRNDGSWRYYDFLIDGKSLVELQGNYYHANPAMYNGSDTIVVSSTHRLASDIWKYDLDKRKSAKEYGYSYLVLWEQDIIKMSDEQLKKEFRKIRDAPKHRKPFIHYPGGKSKHVDKILPFIDRQLNYREPFVGAGSIFLAGDFDDAWINDIDPRLYDLWVMVKNEPKTLISFIEEHTPILDHNGDLQKIKHAIALWREVKENKNGKFPDGYQFLFLNKTCYCGVISAGPTGGIEQKSEYPITARWAKKSTIAKIREATERLQDCEITNQSYSSLLNSKKSICYMDPPYLKKGGVCYDYAFDLKKHKKFADDVANSKCRFVITLDNCEEIREIWNQIKNVHLIEESWLYSMNDRREKNKTGKELFVIDNETWNGWNRKRNGGTIT